MRFPEDHKKPGVSYAMTDDGYELPVIDVTHPAFDTIPPRAELAALRKKYGREVRLRSYLPRFVRDRLIRFLVGRSTLLRTALADRMNRSTPPDGPQFLSGMATYLMKLGAPNLGAAWALPLDRKLAQTYAPITLRLRLGCEARLLADGLLPALRARPGKTVELINLGGGPSMDSINALLLIQKEQPGLLDGRRIRIHVLDRDEAGPRFAARAVEALKTSGGLRGLELALEHVRYDWTQVATLEKRLATLDRDALVAASSEGALFDYAPADVVVANLEALHPLVDRERNVEQSRIGRKRSDRCAFTRR